MSMADDEDERFLAQQPSDFQPDGNPRIGHSLADAIAHGLREDEPAYAFAVAFLSRLRPQVPVKVCLYHSMVLIVIWDAGRRCWHGEVVQR